jgi:hypothetical protein
MNFDISYNFFHEEKTGPPGAASKYFAAYRYLWGYGPLSG